MDGPEKEAGGFLTCSVRGMLADLANELGDGAPIALAAGPVQLLEVGCCLGL